SPGHHSLMKGTRYSLVVALLGAACRSPGLVPLAVTPPPPIDWRVGFAQQLALAPDAIRAVYAGRADQPLWIVGDSVTPDGRALLALAARVADPGMPLPNGRGPAD